VIAQFMQDVLLTYVDTTDETHHKKVYQS